MEIINDAHDAISDGDPTSEIIINVVADVNLDPDLFASWKDHMRYWLDNGAKDSIDILAIDHYPGTWTGFTDCRDWAALDDLISICNEYNKKGAIMETGFSTWAAEDTPWYRFLAYVHTEDDQEIFINNALPIIYDKANSQNHNSENKIVLAAWYTLSGSKPYEVWNIESNFGILHGDYTLKLGFDDLKNQIAKFYS